MVNGLLALSSHEEGYSWQQPKIGNPQPADHALFDRGVCLFFSSGPGSLATMTGEVRAGHGLPGSARHAVLRTAPPLKRPPPPSGLLVGDLHRCREPHRPIIVPDRVHRNCRRLPEHLHHLLRRIAQHDLARPPAGMHPDQVDQPQGVELLQSLEEGRVTALWRILPAV